MLRAIQAVAALAVAAWITFVMVTMSEHHHVRPVPRPAPFSCSQVLRDAAVTGSGGQIAPICGATPYPQTPHDTG